jgi:ketosteroid isomerase-like protein
LHRGIVDRTRCFAKCSLMVERRHPDRSRFSGGGKDLARTPQISRSTRSRTSYNDPREEHLDPQNVDEVFEGNRMWSAIFCAVMLFGSPLPQTHEAPMTHNEGAQSQEQATRTAITNFNEAFNRHDADAMAALLTEDTVFEDTSPAPDGRRVEGKTAVVEFWRGWFAHNADAKFEAEEVIVSGNRAVVLWVYRKIRNGQPWHLRGVDIFTVRDGKVAAKLAYVKG